MESKINWEEYAEIESKSEGVISRINGVACVYYVHMLGDRVVAICRPEGMIPDNPNRFAYYKFTGSYVDIIREIATDIEKDS